MVLVCTIYALLLKNRDRVFVYVVVVVFIVGIVVLICSFFCCNYVVVAAVVDYDVAVVVMLISVLSDCTVAQHGFCAVVLD